jgi:predicted HTH transcriptional regulator
MADTRTALIAIDRLAANPFLTARALQNRLKSSYNTAARAIAALQKAGIVKQTGDSKRDRVYCARAILDILEEPARLIPDPSTQ